MDKIVNSLNTVNNMYKSRGLNIDASRGDNGFSLIFLREHSRLAIVNICEKGWKIPIIKSYTQTIKQGAHCTTHSVRYKRYTELVTSSFVGCIFHSRNLFPQKGRISNILGSNTILLGNPSPDFNMKRKCFGTYYMVYTGKKNTFNRRSIPIISLR